MEEIWKEIKGYEGLYEVSSQGRVRGLDRLDSIGRIRKGKILKPRLNQGYCMVALLKDAKATNFSIHRLVALHFLDKEDESYNDVDHINTIRTDNRVENLRWCNRKINCNNPISREHYREAKTGSKNYFYGKHHTEESKRKIGESKRRVS